jgi:hypothetical protein
MISLGEQILFFRGDDATLRQPVHGSVGRPLRWTNSMNPTLMSLMADYMIEISTSAEEIRKGVETSEG